MNGIPPGHWLRDERKPGLPIRILNPEFDTELFFGRLKKSEKNLLISEYDGILAPFRAKRDRAFPYPEIRRLLETIMKTSDTRLVIVSGRWTRDLAKLLNLQVQPEIWGANGLERLMPDGRYDIEEMDEGALETLVMADEWTEYMGFSNQCEKKPGSLAIHWRGLDDQALKVIKSRIAPKWLEISERSALVLSSFEKGLELQIPGRSKGDAVAILLEEMGKGTVAAYLGNTPADEYAFMSVKEKGVGVFVGNELRPTGADLWVKPPDELEGFLWKWLTATQQS